MILQYELRDLIKIYDDLVNDPVEGDFQKDFVTISDRQEKFGGIYKKGAVLPKYFTLILTFLLDFI